jgi:protein-S-isoprenylcysteine O-methyltransferase Ste14
VPSRLRVSLGWVLGLLVLYLARPTPQSLALGLPLVALGEIVRLWASGHIEKTQVLATGGPYAHSRNPLYVGSVLLALGLALDAASFWVVVAVVAYFAAFYPSVMREEADFLRRKFPDEYRAWSGGSGFRAGSPPAVPHLPPAASAQREWRTALALPRSALPVRGWLSRF